MFRISLSLIAKIFLGLCSLGFLIRIARQMINPDCFSASLSCPQFPWDLVPPLVALGFWAIGLLVWFWGQPTVVVAFFFVGSSTFAAGLLAIFGSDLAGRVFYILLAWLAPLLFEFHLIWSLRPRRGLEKGILFGLGVAALACSTPFMFWTVNSLQNHGWFSILHVAVRVLIVVAFVIIIALLIDQFRRSPSPIIKYRVRMVLFGMVIAFAPLLLFSLLPNVLGLYFIPTEVNFAWLIFIPLSYGYSISHPKFGWMEKIYSRVIVYYLALVLILSGYLVIAEVFARWLPGWANMWAWVSAALSVVTIFFLTRANQIIHRIVDWVVYGSERSNLELLKQMTDTLGLVLSQEKLRRMLVDELVSIIPLAGCAIFLKNTGGSFVIQGKTGFIWPDLPTLTFPGNGRLATYLKNAGSLIDNQVIQRKYSLKTLSAEESILLALEGIWLWIPLVSGEEMYGLLLLGHFPGDYLFTERDHQVWHIFAHQAGIAAHNVLLTEDLQISRNDLARAHQQLLYAREQERRQIAREIHDNAVQQLLGISYQVAILEQKVNRIEPAALLKNENVGTELGRLRQEMLRTTSQLRDLIGELRPAGLEEFGLASALEGFIHKLQRQGGPNTPMIEFELNQNGILLPEAVSICLFRVSQEAIRNSLKHSHAHRIKLHLSSQGNEIVLKVLDDGCGFSLPSRLSELTQSNHYGLVGISERVAWVDGHLDIRSQPGQGTEILVRIPL